MSIKLSVIGKNQEKIYKEVLTHT